MGRSDNPSSEVLWRLRHHEGAGVLCGGSSAASTVSLHSLFSAAAMLSFPMVSLRFQLVFMKYSGTEVRALRTTHLKAGIQNKGEKKNTTAQRKHPSHSHNYTCQVKIFESLPKVWH